MDLFFLPLSPKTNTQGGVRTSKLMHIANLHHYILSTSPMPVPLDGLHRIFAVLLDGWANIDGQTHELEHQIATAKKRYSFESFWVAWRTAKIDSMLHPAECVDPPSHHIPEKQTGQSEVCFRTAPSKFLGRCPEPLQRRAEGKILQPLDAEDPRRDHIMEEVCDYS